MTCYKYIRPAKFLKPLLFTISSIMLFPFLVNSQSFIVKQRYHEGSYYLAAKDYRPAKNNKYFAVDMETATQLPDTVFGRQLFKFQIGTDGPMQDFINDTARSKQKYKLMKWRDKQPGSLYYRDIKAFDEILNRDESLMKKKKKEDKQNNIRNQYYAPSEVIAFHERSERYYLFSTFGIFSIHQDSLQMPARTDFEYTGFRFKGLASARLFNPDVYIMEFEIGPDRKFYKIFDMQAGAFVNVPGLDKMSDVKCRFSRSSPYVIFFGNSTDKNDFHLRTMLFNYETLKVESDIRFSVPDDQYKNTLYLHKNLLYCRYSYFSMGWQDGLDAYDLKNNGKSVYSFKVK